VQAHDRAELDKLMEQEILLEGTVRSAEWSRTGKVMNIEFNDAPEGAMAVVFDRNRQDLDAAFGGDLAAALKGAKVRLKGKLQPYGGRSDRYKDRPQVILRDRSQITILEPESTTGGAPSAPDDDDEQPGATTEPADATGTAPPSTQP
jgi:DNA/RNA endonuclease YhcR with UshA esterase domain